MNSPFDASFAADISAVIADLGIAATIIRAGTLDDTVYPPVTGAPTTHACTVIEDTFSAQDLGANAGIQAGDVKLLVAVEGLDITPTPADSIKVPSSSTSAYSIVSVTPAQPSGVTLMWTIQARRA